MNDDLLFKLVGDLLKILYLVPFTNFYLLLKRRSKFVYNVSRKSIIIGLFFGVIHIIVSLVINILTYTEAIHIDSVSSLAMYEMITNVFFFLSSGLLLMGMYQESKSKITNSDIINLLVFILVTISITSFINVEGLSFRINVILYIISIFFLINSFVLSAELMKDYLSDYYLIIIGAIVLTTDPLLFTTMYNQAALLYPDLMIFNFYNTLRYLLVASAMTLVLIPHVRFMFKVSRGKLMSFENNDSLVENTIKRIYNTNQTVYGKISSELIDKTKDAYFNKHHKNAYFNETLNFTNLEYNEQKKFLKLFLKVLAKELKSDYANSIIKKVSDENNDALIMECLKD